MSGDDDRGEKPTKWTILLPRGTSFALGVIAVGLSLVALLLTLSTSPTATHAVGGPVTIRSTCTHYPDAEITIVAPGRGTIVVRATVGVGINHTLSQNDFAYIVLSAESTDCEVNNYTAFVSIPSSLPTSPYYYETVPLLRPFVVAAGTHTFYLNGIMAQGADPVDRFDSASLVAVFYPA